MASSNGRFPIFFCVCVCDSEKDIYLMVFDRFNYKIRHIDTIFSFSSGVSVVSRLENRPHKRFAYRHALQLDYSGYGGHFLRSCENADHADCRPCRLRIFFFNVSFLFINFFYPNFSSLWYFWKKRKEKVVLVYKGDVLLKNVLCRFRCSLC